MKKIAFVAATGLMAMALSGCTFLQGLTGSSAASTTALDAEKAVQVALTTYADVYQPAVLAYGKLPACPQAVICHDKLLYAKLAAADQAVTKATVAAQSVLEGTATDTGQLQDALTAIQTAEVTIASSGAMTTQH